ncbi:LOB domain-containing protein 1-like [Cucumis melo var. makuwa]|uniref:LOB domain-containing protein 1-like n=2 Tax=Cucumis melo TaxID=3656 RepID=A0A5D3CLP6_CUCMM|nr:LOB domain-containing protein 1-like [Cucumis melo var. makuwa]TYK12232.1 LOB domain-containing protein 1-like [Cucumis melo var. makuwa]
MKKSEEANTASAVVVMGSTQPCAACKILRRRCRENCELGPYFPPMEPLKFTIAHRVFGASNIIKLLQNLPKSQRADAVNSMVYEASARIRDPIYGCAGSIFHLQRQINDLQIELAKAQAEVLRMHCQQANLMTLICKELGQMPEPPMHDHYNIASPQGYYSYSYLFEESNVLEPLWT